jgi:hypothetical protein
LLFADHSVRDPNPRTGERRDDQRVLAAPDLDAGFEAVASPIAAHSSGGEVMSMMTFSQRSGLPRNPVSMKNRRIQSSWVTSARKESNRQRC